VRVYASAGCNKQLFRLRVLHDKLPFNSLSSQSVRMGHLRATHACMLATRPLCALHQCNKVEVSLKALTGCFTNFKQALHDANSSSDNAENTSGSVMTRAFDRRMFCFHQIKFQAARCKYVVLGLPDIPIYRVQGYIYLYTGYNFWFIPLQDSLTKSSI
jgi:hypothetical protein